MFERSSIKKIVVLTVAKLVIKPATQQCHLNEALWGLIGEVCEAYVDDIIMWAKDADELGC